MRPKAKTFLSFLLARLSILCLLQACVFDCAIGKQLPNNHKPNATGPNILVFLVDDLGIGDVGCFGNTTIRTPNIDRLAKEGVKLEHNLAPENLCTPSRAAMLTGRYAIRSGMASEEGYIRVLTQTAVQGGLPESEVTFAKKLQENGYKTGYIGKWHLGVSCNSSADFCHHPNKHGFDYFYGMPGTNQRECGNHWGAPFNDVDKKIKILSAVILASIPVIYSLLKRRMLRMIAIMMLLNTAMLYYYLPPIFKALSRHWFACILMRDGQIVEQPVVLPNLTHRFTTDAVDFIQVNKQAPFLLFMAFAKVHTTLSTMPYFTNRSKHGRYGDNVEEMDWSVGKILDQIDLLGITDNTFVYFTSDHGPDLEEVTREGEMCGGYQGIFKGGKYTSWEGGIRVPTVVRWPGRIIPGSRVDTPTSGLDIFPTILKVANSSLLSKITLDGEDISKILLGETKGYYNHRFIFHYCAKSIQAVTYLDKSRSKVWKIHFVTPNFSPGTQICSIRNGCACYGDQVTVHDPPLLFELNSDPTESSPINLSDSMRNVVEETEVAVKNHKATVHDVKNQLKLVTFLPWLQLCCNPPFCICEEKFPLELIPV